MLITLGSITWIAVACRGQCLRLAVHRGEAVSPGGSAGGSDVPAQASHALAAFASVPCDHPAAMTVREFIEELSACPQDMEVFFNDDAQGCRIPLVVIKRVGINVNDTLDEIFYEDEAQDDIPTPQTREAVLIEPSPQSMREYKR